MLLLLSIFGRIKYRKPILIFLNSILPFRHHDLINDKFKNVIQKEFKLTEIKHKNEYYRTLVVCFQKPIRL